VFGDLVAVDGIGFHIAEGETYGLLGPNGAGKTTTISMVTGLLERDAGDVTLDGKPLTSSTTEVRRGIGLVPQELALYPDLTATENLTFFAKLYGMARPLARQRIAEVLEVTGLTDRAGDRVEKYSGGMKRRLNIGIGLLHTPRLLLLDEPTVGVDPQSRNAILESVERLSGEGMAVLYTTHYMEEAERLCDRVGIIDHGRLEAEGTRHELVQMVGQRDRIRLTASGPLDTVSATLATVPGVRQAGVRDGGIDLIVDDASALLAGILATVAEGGVAVSGVDIDEPDLESVFLHVTGRALRD
jgi:ABC-2 type transport system ATP-binding protein